MYLRSVIRVLIACSLLATFLLISPFPKNAVAQSSLVVELETFSSQNFPFIFLNIGVYEDGIPIPDLNAEDFRCTENDTIQTDYFAVVPPEASGGVRLTDVVFLIDTSGSMGGEIAAVRDNVEQFASALASSDIDYRLGLVQFGNSSGPNPNIFNEGNLTDDVTLFHSFISSLYASGSYEPGFLALRMAVQQFNFRPGAQKIFILITDEDSDDRDKTTTIELLLANDVTVHTAVACSAGYSQSDYCDETSVRGVTEGLLFDVVGPYDQILDTIVTHTATAYVVRYKSSTPEFDGTLREVVCTVANEGLSASVQTSYIPGAGPRVQLTADTVALIGTSLAEGSTPALSVIVTDAVEPYVQDVTLFYRKSGSQSSYTSLPMALIEGDHYEAMLPPVVTPGVDFFVRATDGQLTSALPSTDPAVYPFQIAVLPNVAPELGHEHDPEIPAGQDLTLTASAVDTTNRIDSIVLCWRHVGQLLFACETMIHTADAMYEVTIPGSEINTDLQYYIRATDDLNVSSQIGTPDLPLGLHVVQGEPDLEVIFFDTSRYSLMDNEYSVSVSIRNTGSATAHNHTVTLIEEASPPGYMTIPWPLNDQLNGAISMTKDVLPGDVSTYNFSLSHHWDWVPPKNIAKTILSIGLKLIPTEGIENLADLKLLWSELTTTESILNFVQAQETRTYTYTLSSDSGEFASGLSESASVLVEVSPIKIGYLRGAVTAKIESFICGLAKMIPGAQLYAWVGDGFSFVANWILYDQAYDPDPNYTEIVLPEDILVPEFNDLPTGPGKEMLLALLDGMSYLKASETSFYRYAGAQEANNSIWMSIQLHHTKIYLDSAIEKFAKSQRWYSDILSFSSPSSTTEIEEIQLYLQENGLPNEVGHLFIALSMSPEDYDEYYAGIVEFNPILAQDPQVMVWFKQETLTNLATQLKLISQEKTRLDVEHLGAEILEPTPDEITQLNVLLETAISGLNTQYFDQILVDQSALLIDIAENVIDRTHNYSLIQPYYESGLDAWTHLQALPESNLPPNLNTQSTDIVNEGLDQVLVTTMFTDPNWQDTHTANINWGDGTSESGIVTEQDGAGVVETSHAFSDDQTYTATVEICDEAICNFDAFEIIVLNVAPEIVAFGSSIIPHSVNSTVEISATFTDPGQLDTHTAIWDWGDGTSSSGTIVNDQDLNCATGNHIYTSAGVYIVTLTITDDDGGSDTANYMYVVVYDPDGGFVTGGGWIDSPRGAYTPDPTLSGMATFGFVSKYLRGRDVPEGETEFHFETASNFQFHSTNYEWLVVNKDKAMYSGSGTVNGEDGYNFKLWATDGDLIGNDGIDKFRIKIWYDEDETQYIYDNQFGAADHVAPTTEVEAGSIIIHSTNWRPR